MGLGGASSVNPAVPLWFVNFIFFRNNDRYLRPKSFMKKYDHTEKEKILSKNIIPERNTRFTRNFVPRVPHPVRH